MTSSSAPSTPRDAMRSWKITGILATLVIVLALPIYALKERLGPSVGHLQEEAVSAFVGSASCRDCHKPQYDRWQDSHHDQAMAVATGATVLGDFNDVEFEHAGVVSRFYRQEGRFFVHTQGPDGAMGDFEITYTFGVTPLQQYLVPFPGGRLQCLPIAWDVRAQRWYHLYPDNLPAPDDWLYWTNAGQNWNGMCAECHSTNLKKNYDPETETYDTTWSDIDVGCEACHGPGSQHVAWAQLPDMARPETPNYALAVKTAGMTARQQIELCAPCHSRRSSLGDNTHDFDHFLDYALPQLLTEGMYYADGQILEEVYVYGSFMQSKMYNRDIRCSDCHDVHSTRRIKEGNALCLQCHRANVYDTAAHHFHKKEGEQGEPIKGPDGAVLFEVGSGAACEQCHMPGRIYMGVDYRPDHSFRVPRPDLSRTDGAPNACNRCHQDKSLQWSVDHMTRWYGKKVKPHYGTVFEAGRANDPEALSGLIRIARDRLLPSIVRATALSLLADYPGPESRQAFEQGLSDEDALLRMTAARFIPVMDNTRQRRLLVALLYDEVKAVRIEAAQALAALPAGRLRGAERLKFEQVLEEYRQALLYSADFAASRHNLGNLYRNLGQPEAAEKQYRKAIQIDSEFYPAKVNLAMLYNQIGQNQQAETLLRDVVKSHPEQFELQYSLGLLLAEEKKYREAADVLKAAADGLPQRARIHYNLALLQAYLAQDAAAEASFLNALAIEPGNRDYLYATVDFYMKQGRLKEARTYAEQLVARYPAWSTGHELLAIINRRTPAGQDD
jgi:Tfp pilus assembly protein PilF